MLENPGNENMEESWNSYLNIVNGLLKDAFGGAARCSAGRAVRRGLEGPGAHLHVARVRPAAQKRGLRRLFD